MRKTVEEEWESIQDERRDYEDIDELKEIICDWLDDSIDDKYYFLIHDVVMTHPENTERQELLFCIERSVPDDKDEL